MWIILRTCLRFLCFFFFKQKTAYEMRISDWSSDVCSSDLFMIDHMGYMLEEDGLTEADFQRLLALMQNGYGWLKMSAPYRLAKKRGMEPVNEIAKAIVAAAPDRAIWGPGRSEWRRVGKGCVSKFSSGVSRCR